MKTSAKVAEKEVLPPAVIVMEKRGAELSVVEGEHLIAIESVRDLTEKVKGIMIRAQGLNSVQDQQTADEAGLIVRDIGPVRKFVGQVCDPVCDQFNKKHKAATGLRRFFDQPMATLEDNLKGMIGRFVAAREFARKKQESLAQVQADKEQHKEVRTTSVTTALIHGQAIARDVAADMGSAPPVILEKTEVAGVNTKMVWKAKGEDVKLYAQAAIDGKVPWKGLIFDERFLNDQTESLDADPMWPGVRAYQEPKVGRGR